MYFDNGIIKTNLQDSVTLVFNQTYEAVIAVVKCQVSPKFIGATGTRPFLPFLNSVGPPF